MIARARTLRSRRGAYIALGTLTLLWGVNWLSMKIALQFADPVVFNIHRILLAIAVLFGLLLWQRLPLRPASWTAVVVTAFFQTTLNFGSTTMAVASGGVGRTSVLVFTMPFWTLLLAWPVLGERVRGSQWLAVCLALAGLTLVVEPWDWHDSLQAKLWAILSGFGWAAGTIATKYFQRDKKIEMLNFLTWQMLIGVAPFFLLPLIRSSPPVEWNLSYTLALIYSGPLATGVGFVLWIAVLQRLPAGTAALNMLAIPAIALIGAYAMFDERLDGAEWIGIACIAAGLAIISTRAWFESRRDEAIASKLSSPGSADA